MWNDFQRTLRKNEKKCWFKFFPNVQIECILCKMRLNDKEKVKKIFNSQQCLECSNIHLPTFVAVYVLHYVCASVLPFCLYPSPQNLRELENVVIQSCQINIVQRWQICIPNYHLLMPKLGSTHEASTFYFT